MLCHVLVMIFDQITCHDYLVSNGMRPHFIRYVNTQVAIFNTSVPPPYGINDCLFVCVCVYVRPRVCCIADVLMWHVNFIIYSSSSGTYLCLV